MKPMISSLGVISAVFLVTVPTASALTCSQHAAQLQARQVAAQDMADTRLILVDEVEAAGDAWENAEALRNFSTEQAADADATKVAYDTLKADLQEKESSLQGLVISLNDEVAAYNRKCVRN